MENKEDKLIYNFTNDDTFFIVIRDLTEIFKISDIFKKSKETNLTIVFDFENFCKEINDENDYYLKFKQFISNNIQK